MTSISKKNIRFTFLIILISSSFSCKKDAIDPNDLRLNNIEEAKIFFDWLTEESEYFYDEGTGHWGQEEYFYRNMLRESFMRLDAYQTVSQTTHPNSQRFNNISSEIIYRYKKVADTIGTGVWGIPAEINHPEFGEEIQAEINEGNELNGWIYQLSGLYGSKAGIFFDHGQVLADMSRSYLRTKDTGLLPYINNAAQWVINKNYRTGNVNYFAAALKGLAYAYKATLNKNYSDYCSNLIQMIFNEQNSDGSFGGKHDREAGYHGITTSSLAVARKYIPESILPEGFDNNFRKAVNYLENLKDVDVEYRAAFVVLSWYYIANLAEDNLYPALTAEQWYAYETALQNCIELKDDIKSFENTDNYIYQKGIQTMMLVGSTVAKFYYDYKFEFY